MTLSAPIHTFRTMSSPFDRTPNGIARAPILVLLLLALLPTGCDDGIPTSRPGDAIPRHVFIEAVLDLRAEALRRESRYIVQSEAASILQRHGITAADLTEFVEVHGRNVPYMTAVWLEVEDRLAAMSEPEPPPAREER